MTQDVAAARVDLERLAKLADEATPGPWERMSGRGLVRAIRGDLAVPLFEPLEPYADPLLEASTCRVGKEVVFRANSQAARESAAIRQAVHNAAFIAAANPATIKALLARVAALEEGMRLVEQSIALMTDEYDDTAAYLKEARAFIDSQKGGGA